MKDNMALIRKKLEEKKPVIGTFSHLGGAAVSECLALAGLDYFIVDTEHRPFSDETIEDMIRAASLHGMASFIRIKNLNRSSVLRALDAGADALIVPNVKTPDEVKKLVEYGKFFPLGERGFSFSRCVNYGRDDRLSNPVEFFEKENARTWIIPQCETREAFENIEEIVALEGVAGIFIGPYDLSVALGIPSQLDNPTFKAAIDRILKACKDAGKQAHIFAGTKEQANGYFEKGFDACAISTDAVLLMNAAEGLM